MEEVDEYEQELFIVESQLGWVKVGVEEIYNDMLLRALFGLVHCKRRVALYTYVV